MTQNEALLKVKGLSVNLSAENGTVTIVQDVSFSIKKGQTLALVGESGCGKSTVALSIMRLIPRRNGEIVNGEIVFQDQDLLKLSEKQMRRIRGNEIAMIFQEPTTSLNSVYTVGYQIAETIMLHRDKSESAAWDDAVEMLQKVGIEEPAKRAYQYPHQLSGGMQQRVMIAMATSCKPMLLIADEPTSALDVTTQGQILNLLCELQKQNGMSVLLITHNLGIVSKRADAVAVMYASCMVEMTDSHRLFEEPFHPYTRGLLNSLPRLGSPFKRMYTIPGSVPEPISFPTGCKFHPRCKIGCYNTRCQVKEPELREVQPGHFVACWYAPGYLIKDKIKTSEYGKNTND